MYYWVRCVFYTYISQFTLKVDPHFKCFCTAQFYYPSAFCHFLNHLEVRKPVYCWNNECPEPVHTYIITVIFLGVGPLKVIALPEQQPSITCWGLLHILLNKMCKWLGTKYNSSFRILCICKNSSLFEADCQLTVFR